VSDFGGRGKWVKKLCYSERFGWQGEMGKKVVTDDARPCSFLSSSDLDVRARVKS
jgi:hypothetical protein